jgi:hypothetical protein
MESAARAYRTAIEQRGGYYPEAHQDLGKVLYSTGDLEAANEEYSIAVRQRQGASGPISGGTRMLAAEPEAIRSERITEELEAGLRQAPATADDAVGAKGMTRPLASPLPLEEEDSRSVSASEGDGN